MIVLTNIYLQYSERILFDDINVTIKSNEKIGLVGRNGAGKSTLLKIIAEEMKPDSGSISKPKTASISYLHQDIDLQIGKTVLDEALSAFDEINNLEAQLEELTNELTERDDYESEAYEDILHQIDFINEKLHTTGGPNMEAQAERVLKGLGFKQSDFSRMTDEFSGGWRMRIELAKMLLKKPDYLLLDEPTNHLDIESIIWLEGVLENYHGTVILISHDKVFLDKITKRTIEVELGNVYDYKANYSKYVELRSERREKLEAAYENQQRWIADKERTISRFMAKANKTKMAQSMAKMLDKVERIELDDPDTAAMKIHFPAAPRSGEVVSKSENLYKSYGNIDVLKNINQEIIRGEKIAFVGQNGQGKSTLAKIIVDVEKATKGNHSLGSSVHIAYYAQNQAEVLNPKITLLETMELHSPPEMRTKLRNILGSFLFSGEDVDKKVSVLSGGERARLAMACLLLRPINFLVLDEPTNHLDMISKEVLKKALLRYDGTLLVVSHDRDFLKGMTEKVVEFKDNNVKEYLGDIDYFLEKRKIEDMRSLEMGNQKANSSKTPEKPQDNMSTEELRNAQKLVAQIEKKITKKEEDLAILETQMADSAFYNRSDANTIVEKHKSLKSEINQLTEEWELQMSQTI
jgi:ATP-binding cassette subfamily F protein 3